MVTDIIIALSASYSSLLSKFWTLFRSHTLGVA